MTVGQIPLMGNYISTVLLGVLSTRDQLDKALGELVKRAIRHE